MQDGLMEMFGLSSASNPMRGLSYTLTPISSKERIQIKVFSISTSPISINNTSSMDNQYNSTFHFLISHHNRIEAIPMHIISTYSFIMILASLHFSQSHSIRKIDSVYLHHQIQPNKASFIFIQIH